MYQPLAIEQIVREANAVDLDDIDARSLGVLIEINQRFLEYLDSLELANLKICPEVIVKVDSTAVKFSNEDKFSDWLSELL